MGKQKKQWKRTGQWGRIAKKYGINNVPYKHHSLDVCSTYLVLKAQKAYARYLKHHRRPSSYDSSWGIFVVASALGGIRPERKTYPLLKPCLSTYVIAVIFAASAVRILSSYPEWGLVSNFKLTPEERELYFCKITTVFGDNSARQ